MSEGKFVSYLRVSTARQGRSGLGLEAQRKAVTDFLNGGNWTLVREFVEVESGKRADRPELKRKPMNAINRQPSQFQQARQCGARTRSGNPCRSPATKKRGDAACTAKR
jgi:hypothetical protein